MTCPSPEVFAIRIKAERQRLGLTERAAAGLLAIDQTSYRRYESGTSLPRTDRLYALYAIGMDPRVIQAELFASTRE
jgi:transcriptional regulator with XRE-family HTH domain